MATISFELTRGGSAVRPGTTNAEDPSYNSVFTLTPRTPVLLPAGSVISMQDVAIDVGAAAINFDEPVSFEMQVAPWKTYTTFNQTVVPDAGSVPAQPDYRTPLWVGDNVGGTYTMDTRSATFTLPAGSYTPQGLAEALTTITSAVSDFDSISAGGGNIFLGEAIPPGAGSVKYLWNFSGTPVARRGRGTTKVSSGSTGIFIGCSGLTFEYNSDLGRAVLQYAHEPCLNASSQEIGNLVQNAGGTYFFNLDRSGVVILSCGFPTWEVETNPFYRLGFARSDLEPPEDPLSGQLNPSDCPSYTCTEFSADLLVANSVDLDTPFKPAGYQRLSTGPAGRAASSAPEGFGGRSPRLLVECSLVPPNYVCADGYSRGILCAVSASFESEGFLWTSNSGEYTLPADIVVSQITISLLDPSRGYIPATVGDDSSLVLRVDVPAGFSLLGGLSRPSITAPDKDERDKPQRKAAPRRG